MRTQAKVDVMKCQRCGGNHIKMLFKPLRNPVDTYNWYGICPGTKQPVLMKMTVNKEKPK